METFRRGQAYTKRFGVEFPALISVVIDAFMPLCAPLARFHFGLGDEPTPRLMNPLESRWLENLAKGPLEGSLKQLAQLHRFGGTDDEMKSSLRQRERMHGPLKAIFNQMRALQDKWLIKAAARAASQLEHPAPNKPALNALIAQWAVASARELERLDALGFEHVAGRAQLKGWVEGVLNARWRFAVESFERAPVPDQDAPPKARAYFALSCATLACVYGRWALALAPLYDTLEALSAEAEALEAEGAKVPGALKGALQWLEIAVTATLQLLEHVEPAEARDPFEVGLEIGAKPWTITDRLGVELWVAETPQGSQGVLEELWPRGGELWAQQTQREALSLSTLQHEHIAPCVDWGVDPKSQRWFVAYPLIEGQSLAQRVEEEGALSEAQTRAFMLQVIEALKQALKVGVYHRQLTPDVVLFYTDERLLLTRWGVHRAGIPGWRLSSDQSALRRRFIAPERVDRAAASPEADAKGDLYSVGALIAYALAPHLDPTKPDALEALPVAFQPIVQRALEPNPNDRYPDIGVLERELFNLKPRYNYRGEFGERDALLLTQVVGLILAKPKGLHSIWQPHLSGWVMWREVDEVAQLVEAALAAQAQEVEEPERPPRSDLPERKRATSPHQGAAKPSGAASAPHVSAPMFSRPEPPGKITRLEVCGVLFKMCYVPQGDHLMGSISADPTTSRLERPQHVVTITRPLWVSQTPVTQAQYAALTGLNPSYVQGWQLPVDQVSWLDAVRFCNLLSELEGLPCAYEIEELEGSLDESAEGSSSEGDEVLAPAYQEDEPHHTELSDTPSSVDPEADLDERTEGEALPSLATPAPRLIEGVEVEDEEENEELSDAVRALLFEDEGERRAATLERRKQREARAAQETPTTLKVTFQLNAGGYRLLTEAEWEYTASAGREGAFAGGDDWRALGWFAENSFDEPHPVAQKQPNAWSLCDMSGSVWEWCSDALRTYTRHIKDPRAGAEGSVDVVERVIRGGSWRRSAVFGRVKMRAKANALQRRRYIGFRVARPLLPVMPTSSPSPHNMKEPT